MTELSNRLNKVEEDNVELKTENLELKRENIKLKNDTVQFAQRMSSIESDIDIILRKNGKGRYLTDMFLPTLQNVTFWRATRCGWRIFDKKFEKMPKITIS